MRSDIDIVPLPEDFIPMEVMRSDIDTVQLPEDVIPMEVMRSDIDIVPLPEDFIPMKNVHTEQDAFRRQVTFTNIPKFLLLMTIIIFNSPSK